MYSAQQGLPFSADAYQFNGVEVQPGRPPFIPQIDVSRELANYLPWITAEAIIVIQDQAAKNNFRTFMFNQMAYNGYNNREFSTLIQMIHDLILMDLSQRRYASIEQAIPECVLSMCELWTMNNVRMFVELQKYLQPQARPAAERAWNDYDVVVNSLRSMFSQPAPMMQGRPGYGGQPPQGGYGGQQMGYGQSMAQRSANTHGVGRNYGGSIMNQPAAVVMPPQRTIVVPPGARADVGPATARSPAPSLQTMQKQPSAAATQGGMSVNPSEISMTPTPNASAPYVAASAAASPEIVKPSSDYQEWVPSETFPYLAVYNPYTTEQLLAKTEKGIKLLLNKKADMDIERHKIPTVFGPAPFGLRFSQNNETLSRIKKGIDMLSTERKQVEEEATLPELTLYYKPTPLAELCLGTAWLMANYERLSAGKENVAEIYFAHSYVCSPVFTEVDESDVLEKLVACETLAQLQTTLVDLSKAQAVSVELFTAIDQHLTQIINRVIKSNLAIPRLSTTSFVADYADLEEAIRSSCGERFVEVLHANQKKIIENAFVQTDDDAKNTLLDSLVTQEIADKKRPEAVFLNTDYALVFLNCYFHEMEIDCAPGVGSLITASAMPVLHSLASTIFNASDAEEAMYRRNLIRFNDGHVMELTRGYLSTNCYLLTPLE